MREFQRRLTAPFYIILSLPSTAMGFALSVQISALSWILSTKYGLAIHEIGLVWAAGPIAGIIGQVLVGLISDKVWFWGGRRRPFIVIGGILAALMLLALPYLGVITSRLGFGGILGVAITVALMLDLSINIGFNPTRTLISDVTPAGPKRTKGYTWMQTISGSFGVLAYAIGAIAGNEMLLYFGAGFVLVCSVIPPLLISEPEPKLAREDQVELAPFSLVQTLMAVKPLWGFLLYDTYAIGIRLMNIETETYMAEYICGVLTAILIAGSIADHKKPSVAAERHSIFQQVLAAHSFSWIGVQAVFVYLFAYLQDVMPGLGNDQMGQMVSISFLVFNATAAVVPNTLLAPLARRFGEARTHACCMATMAIGYALVPMAGSSVEALYLLMAFLGIGWGGIVSLPFSIMSQFAVQGRMGLFMGLFNLSVVLPQIFVSTGVGLIISRTADKSVLFVIAAVSLVLSTIIWAFIGRRTGKLGMKCR